MPARSQPERRGELAALQRALAGTLTRPLTAGEGMQRSSRAVAESLVKPNDRLTAFERLQIYNQQYWWRIMGSFREDFRGLHAVLGERKFERLGVAYIEECGSTCWDLGLLGRSLETYLRAHPALTAPHTALALDMARVEWARIIAFAGADQRPLDPAKLGANPEKLRLDLQPHLVLLELHHPIDELLGRLRQRNSEAASNAVSSHTKRRSIRLTAKATREPLHLAVHRVDLRVYYKRLEPGAYRLLSALRAGETLADACAAAFGDAVPADAAERVQAWFGGWTRLGWLVRRATPRP